MAIRNAAWGLAAALGAAAVTVGGAAWIYWRRGGRSRRSQTPGGAAAQVQVRSGPSAGDLAVLAEQLRQEIAQRANVEKALRLSEARARGMFETAVDAIITIDSCGIIESFNPAAQRLFGYTAEEVAGKNVSMLMPAPYRQEHDGYLQRYRETGTRRIIGIGREVVARKKDGTTFPIDLAVGEQKLGNQRLFTGLIRDLTDRKRMELEILQISGREQRRIGQDLHDGLGQQLTGMGFLCKVLADNLQRSGAAEYQDANKLCQLLNEALVQARGLARGLQPVEDAADLPAALDELAHNIEEVFGISCRVDCGRGLRILDAEAATHLYRIAQEATNNAVRHGHARNIHIILDSVDGRTTLLVRDDGAGFPAQPGDGIGLKTMEYRARMIGAVLALRPTSDAATGVAVTCVIDHHALPKGNAS